MTRNLHLDVLAERASAVFAAALLAVLPLAAAVALFESL
jgi:hypothetical protein